MPLSTATISFDIADALGNDFDPRRTKVWVKTNVPGDTLIDTAGNKIRLGSGSATVASDGTGSIVVWVPGAGSNPASWQTTVHVDYPDRNERNGRGVKSFGPFTITADANLADLIAEMPVQPEYASSFLDLVQGYSDHGSIDGTLTLDPAIGTHVVDASGPLLVSIDDAPNGAIVTLLVTSGAADVTIDGIEATLTDGGFATFVRIRGAWVLASSGAGGEPSIPDTTPPTAVTDLTATGGSGQLTYSWTAATDAESAVKYGVKVWKSTDTEPASYTIRTTGGPVTVTGLTAGTYNVKLYSFSNGGSTTPDTATATVTAPEVHDILDIFDGSGLLTAHSPNMGGGLWTKAAGAGTLTLDGAGKAVISGANSSYTDYIQAGVTFTDGEATADFVMVPGVPDIGVAVRHNGSNTRIFFGVIGGTYVGIVPISGGTNGSVVIGTPTLTNGLTYRLTLVVAGTVATARIQRLSDGKYANTSDAWVDGETTFRTATVVSSSGSPGLMFAQTDSNGAGYDRFTADS